MNLYSYLKRKILELEIAQRTRYPRILVDQGTQEVRNHGSQVALFDFVAIDASNWHLDEVVRTNLIHFGNLLCLVRLDLHILFLNSAELSLHKIFVELETA